MARNSGPDRFPAGKKIGEMGDSEPHFGAERPPTAFARDKACVDRLRRIAAIVAIAAAFGRVFAKVAQQDGAAAARAFDQAGQGIESFALGRLTGVVHFRRNPPPGTGKIVGTPEQPGFGRLAIASGATGFLVKGLDRLGYAGMGDEDVRLSWPSKAIVATITAL